MRILFYFVLYCCTLSIATSEIKAQAWSMTFEDSTQVNLSWSAFHAFQNGDILTIQQSSDAKGFILSRMSRDLSTVIRSAKLYLEDLIGADIDLEQPTIWTTFAYIDSGDRLWVQLRSDHFRHLRENHSYLIGIDQFFEVFSSFRTVHRDQNNRLFIKIAEENIDLGYIDFYTDQGVISTSYKTNKIRCTYDGSCQLTPETAYIIPSYYSVPNFSKLDSLVLVSHPGTNTINNLQCRIIDIEQQSLSMMQFNSSDFLSGPVVARSLWLNPEEFLILMYSPENEDNTHPDGNKLLAARCHKNGTIQWSKIYQIHHEVSIGLNFIQSLVAPMEFLTIEDQKVFLNGTMLNYNKAELGAQVQYAINLEEGSIETSMWSTLLAFNSRSFATSKRLNGRYYFSFVKVNAAEGDSVAELVLLHDNPENDITCYRLENCSVEVRDIDLRLIEQSEQKTTVPMIDTIPSNVWFHFSTEPFVSDNELLCENQEIVLNEITIENDELLLCSMDTLVVNIENLLGVEIIRFTDLNGLLNPIRDGLNSFHFPFDIIEDSVLYVEIDRLGCIWMDTIEIEFPQSPEYEIDRQYTICMDSLLELQLPDIEDHLAIWPDSSSTLMTNEPGYHFFNIYSELNPCEYTDSIFLRLDELPEFTMDTHFEFCPELGIFEPPLPEGSFTAYNWYNPFNEQIENPQITDAGTWLLELENGSCSDTIQVLFASIDCSECQIFIPNAFTPNDDMINDSWGIYSDCIDNISNFQLQIFDRWGNLVYQSDQPDGFWDGSKGGQPLTPGVYVYSITFSVLDPLGPRDVEEKGSLTLLR